jgi:hypothetical protein
MNLALLICLIGATVYVVFDILADVIPRLKVDAVRELSRLAFLAGLLAYLLK